MSSIAAFAEPFRSATIAAPPTLDGLCAFAAFPAAAQSAIPAIAVTIFVERMRTSMAG